MLDKAKSRLDSWYNALTGLGNVLRDKAMSTTFLANTRLTSTYLDDLYHDDDTAAKICDALPSEALRKGYYLTSKDSDDNDLADQAQEYEKKILFRKALKDCAIWARAQGGAVIYLGIDDGLQEDQPVNEGNIREIRFAHVLTRQNILPLTYYVDAQNDGVKFGKPSTYQIVLDQVPGSTRSVGSVIHETRLIRMDGSRTSVRRMQNNEGWAESILQRVNDTLVRYGTTWQSISHLLQDMGQGVFQMEGLIEMIASGEKDLLQSRMEIVDMSRSTARAILLDAEKESFSREGLTFQGLPDVIKMIILRMASAARMPVSVFMGQAPSGLNATGDSDIRLWYDSIEEYRTDILTPAIERFYQIMFLAKDFPGEAPPTWQIAFGRLWQMTDKEQADVEKTVAEKDKIYMDSGVLLPEEVALSRHQTRGFSMETQIDQEAREEMMQAEIELAKSKAGEEPPTSPAEGSADGSEK